MKENKNFIFGLILIIPIIFSSCLYYYEGFLNFGRDFNFYIFSPNLTFDENTHYFPKVLAFIDNLTFNINDNVDSKNYNFLQFVLIFFSSLIVIIFGDIYAPFFLDFISISLLLIINYYFFYKILRLQNIYIFPFLTIYIVFFTYGPFTYNFYVNLIWDIELKTYHHIFRQFSPTLTSICLVIGIIAHYNVYKFDKLNIFNFILIVLSYFAYGFNSIIQIIFFSLSFCYLFLFGEKKQIIIKLYLINLITFFIWYYFQTVFFDNKWFSKFLLYASNDYNFEVTKNLINLFFISINLFLFYKNKNYNFLFLGIFLISCLILFNISFIVGYDPKLYHADMYFAKPAQWISLFLFINLVNDKFFLKIIKIIALSVSILFFLSHKNFVEKIFYKYSDFMTEQQDKRDSFKKIKNIVKNSLVHTLDPHFILYGFYTTSSKNFIYSSDYNLTLPPKNNLINFIKLADYLNLSRDLQHTMITNKKLFFLNGKHNMYQHIIFLQDSPNDLNFKMSLVEGQKTNLKKFINDYKNKNKNLNFKYLLISKKNKKKFNYFIDSNLSLIYEDENYLLFNK